MATIPKEIKSERKLMVPDGLKDKKYLPVKVSDDYYGGFESCCNHLGYLANFDQECGVIVSLDGVFKVNSHLVSLGGWKNDITDLNVLFARMLSDKTNRYIYAHNHPNGIARFSEDDIRFTVGMLLISEVMRMECVDHILFAYDREPISFKKKYPKIFNKNWMGYFDKTIKESMKRARRVI